MAQSKKPVVKPGHQLSKLIVLAVCVLAVAVLGALPAKKVHNQVSPQAVKPAVKVASAPAPAPTPPAVPVANCSRGSLMTVVAHEDDDILFTNPDLQQDIQAGFCVTTVFLTAGDAGKGAAYWQRREAAAEIAYSEMYRQSGDWSENTTAVAGHDLTTARLSGEPGLTLVFYRLPDGNLNGQGFSLTGHESLAALRFGRIDFIHSVDGAAAFTRSQLINSLTALMDLYAPTIIHTQNYNSDVNDGDHSDHHAAGYFTEQAYKAYPGTSTLRAYAGYTVRGLAPNVSGQNLLNKQTTFLIYAAHDAASCSTTSQCEQESGYGAYLERQYSVVVASKVQAVAPPVVVVPAAVPKPKPKAAPVTPQNCPVSLKNPKICSLKQ